MAHDTLLTVFVILAALAIVGQALVMGGILIAMRDLHRDIDSIHSSTRQKLDVLTQRVTDFIATSREPVHNVAANLAEITRILRERTGQFDSVAADLLDRTRLQIIRIDQMVTGMVEKAQSTAGVVEQNVMTPVHEVSALIAGVRKGLEFLFAQRRSAAVSESTQDEQMFI